MTHTDPTFRGLLLAIATDLPPSQRDTLPILADFLEEHGDARAEDVRWALREGDGRLWLDIARDVLALFPEGPQWTVEVGRRGPPGSGWTRYEGFRLEADARDMYYRSREFPRTLIGPVWSAPSLPV